MSSLKCIKVKGFLDVLGGVQTNDLCRVVPAAEESSQTITFISKCFYITSRQKFLIYDSTRNSESLHSDVDTVLTNFYN